MQRLGHNRGGYLGETINITNVLGEIEGHARAQGWRAEPLAADNGLVLPTWHRAAAEPRQRVYISAGIHGDEPAGPMAVGQLLKENQWPAAAEVWLCPCLNPAGFALNRRENGAGLDLNRQYRHLE